MIKIFKIVALCISTIPLYAYELSHTIKKIDQNKVALTLTFNLKPGEYLYKEGFIATVNNPSLKLSPLTPSVKPLSFFDEASKKQKEGYKNRVSFTADIEKEPIAKIKDTIFHLHFLVSSNSTPQEKIVELPFTNTEQAPETKNATTAPLTATAAAPAVSPAHEPSCEPRQPSFLGTFIQRTLSWVTTTAQQAKKALSSLFSSTGSRVIRFGAALLLGILLSLTPCIYPMIPITIGILQASGSPSAGRNFLLALCYTLGISTTFAVLGFIAAVGSCVFGEMQGSPWFVIPLALLLIYFALTMFDWVQFYTPKFLQPKVGRTKGGSALSAYIFGAVSGTIASPCLSPGLLLILQYVTTISGSSFAGYLEGFFLLFLFGIGSSLPLLIIGTFSSSLHILPRAGQWMVEIKKIVGIMLICMAFYQLSHLERLLPWYLFVWVIVLTFFALGIYYFVTISSGDRPTLRRYKNFMGTALIIVACIMLVQAQKAIYDHLHPQAESSAWMHDYREAQNRAQQEHKLLFIDIGATYCSACTYLDGKVFGTEKMQAALTAFVQLKIDSDVHTQAYEKVKELYGRSIEGFPTYLVVNPANNQIIKKWTSDIDQVSIASLVEELGQVSKTK